MEVDHILPERLISSVDDFEYFRTQYALEDTFKINSFENWLPSCHDCNIRKSGTALAATPIIAFHLDRARKKASEAQKLAQQTVSNRKIENALALIIIAVDANDLPADKLAPVIGAYLKAHPDTVRAMLDEQDRRAGRLYRSTLGLQSMPQTYLELRLTPFAKVLYTSSGVKIVSTPLGVGFQPTNPSPDASFYCGHCGSLGPWDGARCLSCGYLSESD